jgi:hypothetical protein
MATSRNILALTGSTRLLNLLIERGGVQAWNRWIGVLFDNNLIAPTWGQTKPPPPLVVCLDFSDADLSESILDEIDLGFALLLRADFSGSSLRRARLAGVQHARFIGADLRDAKFEFTDVSGCSFDGAQLSGAAFHECSCEIGFTPTGLPKEILERLSVNAHENVERAEAEVNTPADLLLPASLIAVRQNYSKD